jgi:seryl-tRNA synthetase
MLQLAVLRNETEWVKQRLAVKHFHDVNLVDTILLKDEMKRKLQTQSEELQAKQNASAKEIGKLMASGEKDKAEAIKADVASQKETGKQLLEQVSLLEKEIHDCLVQLPNLPNSIVPLGKTPEENEVVKTGNDVPQLHANALPHWDLVAKHNLIDFELGTKITGAGFPVYINQGARLQRGLINYFLDFNTAAGYTEYQVPHMVNAESAFATGQLPDKEGQMYHATVDDFYLIPTAEVPVTNIYRDTIIKENQLPTKLRKLW